MKNVLTSPKTYMLAGLLVIVVTASAWQLNTKKQHKDTAANSAAAADTTEPRQHDIGKDDYGMKGFDEGMKQLDLALKNIDFNFKGLDTTIEKTVREALANIDFNAITKQATDAIKNIDWKEINTEVSNALNEAQEEVKNIDMTKVNAEIKEAMDKVNSKEFKEQFDGAALQKIINDAMYNVREGMGKVKEELRNWKDFTDGLEKDGLINKNEHFKIEWKNEGKLYINGKEQPKEISDKYHKYYKQGGYTINSNGDDDDTE